MADSTKTELKIISQKNISKGSKDSAWLHSHGCSLIAESYALQWLGINKTNLEELYNLHKKYTKDLIAAKVRIKALPTVINKLAGKKGKATYHSKIDDDAIKEELLNGNLILFEREDPIHTITFFQEDDGKNYVIYNGENIGNKSLNSQLKKACKNSKYKGYVVVERNDKKPAKITSSTIKLDSAQSSILLDSSINTTLSRANFISAVKSSLEGKNNW